MLASRALTTFALLATVVIAVPAFAANAHDSRHDADAATTAVKPALSAGTVKKVDKATGKITISHGPLDNLGMPPMTMVFRAGEPSILDGVEAGDKIRFTAERVEGVFRVTKLEATN